MIRRSAIRRPLAVSAVALALLGATTATAAAHTKAKQSLPTVRRVLVFSIPHVSWEDIDRFDLPNLRRLLDDSAVADLTTRADLRATRLADGYVTLGAGSRAVGFPSTDGDVLGVDEQFGEDSAAQVFRQRTGRDVSQGLVSLGLAGIVDANEALLYDAEIGALGDALADADVSRAVIGNGDGDQPDTEPSALISEHQRQAGLALMTSKGTVPDGQVDDELLERDSNAPFGARLDEQAVLEAFDESWRDDSVVLVEASDLVRADSYRIYETEVHRRVQLRAALRRTDRLLGELLARVDLERDAVLVVGPAHSSRAITLTPFAVHAPGTQPGLLRSATTRRSGFVQLIDVGPTILKLVGIDRPANMEGRAVEVGSTGGTAADRRQFLIDEDAAAQFRDKRVGEVITTVVVAAAALIAAAIFWIRAPQRRTRWRRALLVAPLAVISFLPAVYLARLAPLYEMGVVGYWSYLVVVTAAIAGVAWFAGRRCRIDSLIVVLLIVVGVLFLDIVRGTPWMFNSVLGYSPTVAGRFAGFGNPAYAAFAVSALLAAALIIFRVGPPRGRQLAFSLLAGAIVVDGAPWWGSDVGGILSMVPAYAIFTMLVLGWRLHWRTMVLGIAGLVVAAAGFIALDLSRPPDNRTHLGRLIERIDQRGFGDFLVVLQRKLSSNIDSLQSAWAFMVPILVVLVVWLARRVPERLRAAQQAFPQWRPAWIAFLVLAGLGYALNDSGTTVPGVMIAIFIASLVFLLAETADEVPQRAQRTRP